MKQITTYIDNIQNLGIGNELSSIVKKNLRLFNGVLLLTACFMFLACFTDFIQLWPYNLTDLPNLADYLFAPTHVKANDIEWKIILPASEFVYLVILAGVLLLNSKSKFNVSKFIFCLSTTLLADVIYIMQGSDAVSFIVISFIFPVMLYNKQVHYIIFMIFNALTSLAIATYLNEYSTLVILPESYTSTLIYFNLTFALILLSLIINHFKSQNTKYEIRLNEQNVMLESQSEEIRAQKDELQETNNELLSTAQELRQKNEEMWVLTENIISQKNQIESAHKHITDSINSAKRIQKAVFPRKEFLKELFPAYFVLFRPRDVVSGDFYWFTRNDNRIFIIVADCTGHGVPGAFMSLLGISFLTDIISTNGHKNAGEILDLMRIKIKVTLNQTGDVVDSKDGMDLALCVLEPQNGTMQFAGANNPLYLLRKQGDEIPTDSQNIKLHAQNGIELIEVKPNYQPIAVYKKERPFTTHTIKVQKGDKFYLFTDGYVDQFGGRNEFKFLAKNLKSKLLEMFDSPMSQQKTCLVRTLDEWKQDIEQVDDILILGVEI